MLLKQSIVSTTLTCLCSVVLLPSPSEAHHGVTGQFDLEQVLTVSGAVNPLYLTEPYSHSNTSLFLTERFIPYDCEELNDDGPQ